MKELHFLSPRELKESRVFFELRLPNSFHWFLWGLFLLLIAMSIWAVFGEMDVVVKGSAVLQPRQNVSEVVSALTGRVIVKNFSNGQKVQQGDVLWKLDNQDYDIDRLGTLSRIKRDKKRLHDLRMVSIILANPTEILPEDAIEAQRMAAIILAEDKRLELLAIQAGRVLDQQKKLPESAQTKTKLMDLEITAQIAQGEWDLYRKNQIQNNYEAINNLLSAIDTQEQHLAELDQKIRLSEVRSPLDGWVEEINKFNVGDTIFSGTTVVRVIPENARDLKAVITVSSDDIAEISKGLKFRLIFPKLPSSEFGQLEGTLDLVPEDAWLINNNFYVFQLEGSLSRLWLENSRGLRVDLKSGMTAETRIIIKRKPIWRYISEKLDLSE